MRVALDAFALCEAAADLVGATLEKFKENRRKKNLTSRAKVNSIVDAIMAKPKKFLHLSMEVLLALSDLNQTEFRNLLVTAVTKLGNPKYKTMVQVTVFESCDERVLRGNNKVNILQLTIKNLSCAKNQTH